MCSSDLAAFGLFGLVCARANIPTIPLILGMVMGDTLEAALRQVLGRSEGTLTPFVTRPISLAIGVLIVFIVAWPWLRQGLQRAWPARSM